MSCEACRHYHYKCDNALPKCGRCAKVGRICVKRDQYRFRNTSLPSQNLPNTQPKPPRGVVFVHENDVAERPADADEGDEAGPSADESMQYQQNADLSENTCFAQNAADERVGLSWPVENEQEAFLIRHFVSTVSHFFDFCDPRRHFARMVPQRMRLNGTLANAVLALSARHLSRTSTFDAYVADVYYQQCLAQLIPALADNVQDESLLVAAVVLRLMEEIDVPLTGGDLQNHLVGTKAIARAQEEQLLKPNPAGLLQAAHWAALRQELYISFATRRPMSLTSLDFFRALYSPESLVIKPQDPDDDDATWANLAVLQCCDVAQFVFGSNSANVPEYERLASINRHWRDRRPASFDPFYRRNRTAGSPIPDIRFLTDWSVMGHMYNLLTGVVLAMNNPAGIATGSESRNVASHTVGEMIGIALHNPNTSSAHLVASMAIAISGQCLNTDTEVAAMKQILSDTETFHGWPTATARQAL